MRLANGKGSISKSNDKKRRNKYIVRSSLIMDCNGKKIRYYIGSAKTLKEATKLLDEYNKKTINYNFVNITLKDCFEKWKLSKHATSLKTEATFNYYISTFNRVLKPLLEKSFIKLTYKDYKVLIEKIPKTVGKTIILLLNKLYIEAIKLDMLKDNIALKLEASNIKTRYIQRPVYEDYIVKDIWNKYNLSDENQNYYGMILIIFYSGIRGVELKKLQNRNISIKEKYFITGSKTKAGIDRKIPIHNKILPIFEKYINDGEYLFPELSTVDKLQKRFKNIVREYNIAGNLHSIRHTFITKLQRIDDIRVSKIKTIVGHKQEDITDGVYTHYNNNDLLEVINKLKYDASN